MRLIDADALVREIERRWIPALMPGPRWGIIEIIKNMPTYAPPWDNRKSTATISDAELGECLKKIKQYCMERDCDKCCLNNVRGCAFEGGVSPAGWWLENE